MALMIWQSSDCSIALQHWEGCRCHFSLLDKLWHMMSMLFKLVNMSSLQGVRLQVIDAFTRAAVKGIMV